MLLDISSLIAFVGTAVSFWLAAYLLARGFPSRVTLRAALVMAALGLYFFSAYVNAVNPAPGSTIERAVLLVWALVLWYDLTVKLVPAQVPGPRRLLAVGAYTLAAAATALVLVRPDAIRAVNGNPLWSARGAITLPFVALAMFHFGLMAATLYNFRLIRQAGGATHTRYFLGATLLAAVTTGGYYILAQPGMPSVPTAVQGSLLLLAVGTFGYAVARHQALIERRTTLQDFPISGLVVVGLACVYALLAKERGFTRGEVAGMAALAVLTHSGVDLAREFLDRLLHRHDARLRQQLRRLGRSLGGDRDLEAILRRGLAVLVQRLEAGSGFVALRQGDQLVVTTSLRSLAVGSAVAGAPAEELTPAGPELPEVAWLAPVRVGGEQVAVIGLGAPRTLRRTYAEADLDVLAEMADWVGLMVTSDRQQRETRQRLADLVAEAHQQDLDLRTGPEDLLTALRQGPPPEFVRQVEEALRHLSDYTFLGQSPLTAELRATGATHIERGKAVRARLVQALEMLRPAAKRPGEPLPREWHGYVVLADAYLEDVPNREIMARLYISQGTFNRARRKALQAVARNLLEMHAEGVGAVVLSRAASAG